MSKIPNAPYPIMPDPQNPAHMKWLPLREAVRFLLAHGQNDDPATDAFMGEQAKRLDDLMQGTYGSRMWKRFVLRVMRPKRNRALPYDYSGRNWQR